MTLEPTGDGAGSQTTWSYLGVWVWGQSCMKYCLEGRRGSALQKNTHTHTLDWTPNKILGSVIKVFIGWSVSQVPPSWTLVSKLSDPQVPPLCWISWIARGMAITSCRYIKKLWILAHIICLGDKLQTIWQMRSSRTACPSHTQLGWAFFWEVYGSVCMVMVT